MAQSIVTGDVIKVQLWSQDSEQASVNTWHYRIDAVTGINPDLADWLHAFVVLAEPKYLPLLSQQANLVGALAQIVQPLPLMIAVKEKIGPTPGTGGAVGMGRQLAGLLSWKTPFAGPGGRGRTYIPFPSATDTEDIGVPTDAYVNKLLTFGVGISSWTSASLPGGSTTTQHIGLKGQLPADFRTFNDLVPAKKWATMKKRGSYGRPNTPMF